MKATEQTIQQIERFIRKIAQKYQGAIEDAVFTDIHIRLTQESGEVLVFDDDDTEITRCVVEQWIDNKDEDFYDQVTNVFRGIFNDIHDIIDNIGIMKPFSLVLENEDKEIVAELYVADDDTIIIGDNLMKNMDADLDSFLDDLLKKD